VALSQTAPIAGKRIRQVTFMAVPAPADAGLLTMIWNVTWEPWTKVPLSGVLSTFNSGGG